jgi:hypothetical protein
MSKNLKSKITTGEHDLIVSHFRFKGGRVHLFLKAPFHDCDFVQRTYIQGSDALRALFLKLTGKEVIIASEAACRILVGIVLKALIIQSPKRPQYMDLERIVTVYVGDPPIQCACINGSLSVIDSKITEGGSDAGQVAPNLP